VTALAGDDTVPIAGIARALRGLARPGPAPPSGRWPEPGGHGRPSRPSQRVVPPLTKAAHALASALPSELPALVSCVFDADAGVRAAALRAIWSADGSDGAESEQEEEAEEEEEVFVVAGGGAMGRWLLRLAHHALSTAAAEDGAAGGLGSGAQGWPDDAAGSIMADEDGPADGFAGSGPASVGVRAMWDDGLGLGVCWSEHRARPGGSSDPYAGAAADAAEAGRWAALAGAGLGAETAAAACLAPRSRPAADVIRGAFSRIVGAHAARAEAAAAGAGRPALAGLGDPAESPTPTAAAAAAAASARLLLRSVPAPGLADAASLLRSLPPSGRAAARLLVAVVASRLSDASPLVRAEACRCAARLGPAAVLALPSLPIALSRRLLPLRAGSGSLSDSSTPAVTAPSPHGPSERDVDAKLDAVRRAVLAASGRHPRALTAREGLSLGAEPAASVRAAAAAACSALARAVHSATTDALWPHDAPALRAEELCRSALSGALVGALIRGEAPRADAACALVAMGHDARGAVEAVAVSALGCGVVPAGLSGALLGPSRAAARWRAETQAQVAAVRSLGLLPLPRDGGGGGGGEEESVAPGPPPEMPRTAGQRLSGELGSADAASAVLWRVLRAASGRGDDGDATPEPVVAEAAVRAVARLARRAGRRRLAWPGGGAVPMCEAVPSLRPAALVRGLSAIVLARAAAGPVARCAAATMAELGPEGELLLTEIALSGVGGGAGGPAATEPARASTAARAAAAWGLGQSGGRAVTTLLLLASGAAGARHGAPGPGGEVAHSAAEALARSGGAGLAAAALACEPAKRRRLAKLARMVEGGAGAGLEAGRVAAGLAATLER